MKIPQKELSYEEVMALPRPAHKKVRRSSLFFRTLIRLIAIGDLRATSFRFTKTRMEEAGRGPWLILMNHSSFIDLEIVSRLMYPKPYHIVTTSDGFVGKEGLMRAIGCIPTNKFVTDLTLISDIERALSLGSSVLMYPEASYSFDGCQTPLPRRMSVLLKRLGVPVIMIKTEGAFARDPLYNCLQKRKVSVSADMRLLFSREELRELPAAELDARLDEAFSFDNWTWQEENGVEITEPFRADGLNRILYKCADCGCEGRTVGAGTGFTCEACGKHYTLDTLGRLAADDGLTRFPHIPDWYAWERASVRRELEEGRYCTRTPVRVAMMVDFKSIYFVGHGTLVHDENGFVLDACEGRLHYTQGPLHAYSVYSDYFWYEIGDVICIGTNDCLYYCFPEQKDLVAKLRLAAEELFKIKKANRLRG